MRTRRAAVRLAVLATALLAFGCRPALRPGMPAGGLTRLDTVPRFTDEGDPAALAEAIRASLAYYERLPPERALRFGPDEVQVSDLQAALGSLAAWLETNPSPAALSAEVGRRFVAYRARAPRGVLFTGYYVPTLAASPTADARFRLPVLGRPPDLITVAPAEFGVDCPLPAPIVGRVTGEKLVPYFTRAEIATGAVAGAPALAWVDDPVALFFLQIQGSGRLLMPDGSRRTVGYAVSNGHRYMSIGKLLIDEGRLAASEASMAGIQRWAAAHPAELDRLLNANPRYVFFRVLDGPPLGSLGVPVTAERSIATDPRLYPPGALALVRIAGEPVAGSTVTHARTRLVLNQDAGAAIEGPGRVDVFFGEGAEAQALAGSLKAHGDLVFLAPRR